MHRTRRRSGRDTKIRCIGSIYSLLNGKDGSTIKQHVMQSSFTTHSQLIVSRKLLWWNLEKSYTTKYICHLGFLQRFPSKIIGWKNWIQKSLEAAKRPNESNRNQKTNHQEQGIEKDVLFGREGTIHSTRTERPVDGSKSIQSCVSMSVDLVDKYEDKDENADTDQTRTVKPVSGQPTCSFTQLEEIDIDSRVPRLSHAGCERSRKFPSSRACEKDRKSSSSRSTSSRFAAE